MHRRSGARLLAVAVAIVGASAGSLGLGAPPASARADGLAARADWLTTLNWYRTASGVPPVAEEWPWNDAVRAHLRYLAHTPTNFRVGEFTSDHTENPASPRWSAEGERAAKAGNYGNGASEREAIENWMVAPFHAIGMLRASLTKVGFALESGRAGIDVVRGVVTRPRPTAPVLFPADGATVMLARLPPQGELPDPRAGCPTGASWTGLPILAMLPTLPPAGTSATLVRPDGTELDGPAELCVQTAATYRASDDPVYGPTGTSLLRNDRAAIILPPEPLRPGRHTVSLHQPGRPDITWSFTVAAEPAPAWVRATPDRSGSRLRVEWDRPVDRLAGAWFEIAQSSGPAPGAYRYLGDVSWTDVTAPRPGESVDVMVRSCNSQLCSEPAITRVDVLLPAAPQVAIARTAATSARVALTGEVRTITPIDELRVTVTVVRGGRTTSEQTTRLTGRTGSVDVPLGTATGAVTVKVHAESCAVSVCGPATDITRELTATSKATPTTTKPPAKGPTATKATAATTTTRRTIAVRSGSRS